MRLRISSSSNRYPNGTRKKEQFMTFQAKQEEKKKIINIQRINYNNVYQNRFS